MPLRAAPGGRDHAMTPESLFQEAQAEANRYKYLESERAGHDLGPAAIDDWHRHYWPEWFRHRWVEHLLGLRCWEELEAWRFGRLPALFPTQKTLLGEIVGLFLRGAENADILWWAARERRSLPIVMAVLTEMRINEIRCSRQCFLFAQSAGD